MLNVPGGKGSSTRPSSVSTQTFDKNWDIIFGKDKKVGPQTTKDKHECKNACSGCKCKESK